MTSIAAAQKSNLNEYAVASVIRELQTAFAGRVVTSLAVREQHGNTVTWVKAEPPDAVVFPHSTQEVSPTVGG
jgi:D-lactate dehydrogenase (cytochrome)